PLGHRDYTPGENFRHIDWHLAARHDELRVKEYPGDEDAHLYLLIDVSQSMNIGTPSKLDLAVELAGGLAYVALAGHFRVSVVLFADQIVGDYPLSRGRQALPGILGFLESAQPTGGQTNLSSVANAFVERQQRHGRVVVISDFYDESGFRGAIDLIRRRGHEPFLLQVHTREEAMPRSLGDARLDEVEDGSSWATVITGRALAKYERTHAEFIQSVKRYGYDYGYGCQVARTDRDFDYWLARMIGPAQ
ncbi:MAG: DUF58 domain-containing protein, partial [Pirellulales bacterium]|nr:DUF58 domain-containing protein [Pirellulales bacterium]